MSEFASGLMNVNSTLRLSDGTFR